MTGKPDSLEEMPEAIQNNVHKTLALNSKSPQPLTLRWFGDTACRKYIKQNYDDELLGFFDHAKVGAYRSDICRAAVLYKEGGFYLDVDLEMAVPVSDLADQTTTFASAFTKENNDVFNAVIVTVPRSEIMEETLKQIRKWFRSKTEPKGLMGTQTMFLGMQDATHKSCNVTNLMDKKKVSKWTCGQHVIRMYEENDLNCFPDDKDPNKDTWLRECPEARRNSNQYGMRLGLFPAGAEVFVDRPIFGWSRYSACTNTDNGCGTGGHRVDPNPEIPRQLIMTGRPAILEETAAHFRKNVLHTLALNKKSDHPLKFRWFGDTACREYIKQNYDQELLEYFDNAKVGSDDSNSDRAGICRVAILYNEGGFYLDGDLELAVPISEIADDKTTFASAFTKEDRLEDSTVLNSIIATVPKSLILQHTLTEVRKWYGGKSPQTGEMGKTTLYRGMRKALNQACQTDIELKKKVPKWTCGNHELHMFEVADLFCFPADDDPNKKLWEHECPVERANSHLYTQRLGLFPAGQDVFLGREMIAWPRYTVHDEQGSFLHESNLGVKVMRRQPGDKKVALSFEGAGQLSFLERALR
jgi:hypothetical protein